MLVGQMDGFATTRPSESTASRLLPLPKNSRFLLRNRTKGPTILEGAFLMSIPGQDFRRSEEHTSELQSRLHLVCRLLLEKKKIKRMKPNSDKRHKHEWRVDNVDMPSSCQLCTT